MGADPPWGPLPECAGRSAAGHAEHRHRRHDGRHPETTPGSEAIVSIQSSWRRRNSIETPSRPRRHRPDRAEPISKRASPSSSTSSRRWPTLHNERPRRSASRAPRPGCAHPGAAPARPAPIAQREARVRRATAPSRCASSCSARRLRVDTRELHTLTEPGSGTRRSGYARPAFGLGGRAGPRSSGDRASPSGGVCAGSNPAEGAPAQPASGGRAFRSARLGR